MTTDIQKAQSLHIGPRLSTRQGKGGVTILPVNLPVGAGCRTLPQCLQDGQTQAEES